jgi:hypothetical protein
MCNEEAGGSVHSGIAKLVNVGRCQVDTLTSFAHGIRREEIFRNRLLNQNHTYAGTIENGAR